MPEHYHLPKINVSFCVIPKTGCTTLKNYLFSLEQAAEQNPGPQSSSLSFIGQDIHRPRVLRDYLVNNLDAAGPKQSFKILVLRNPHHRVRSAWMNKLLFAQHDFRIFERLKEEEFTPIDFETVEQLCSSFEKFAEKLSKDKKFLHSDGHWLPQVEFFGKVSDYDLVVETANLPDLEAILEKQLGLSNPRNNQSFPRFNETNSKLVDLIGTKRAWDLIEKTYAGDFKALEQAGIAISRPDQGPAPVNSLSPAELEAEKQAIRESRRLSEVRSLRHDLADHDFIKKLELEALERQISDIKRSWSWKLTAWLRFLGKLFVRRRGN